MPTGVYPHKKGRKIIWKDKISKSLKGRILSKEHRKNISLSLKGKPSNFKGKSFRHTEEAKEKIGQAQKGNSHCLGKKLKLEHRKKISEATKGRIVSIETRQKIRKSLLGTKRPDVLGERNPMFTHRNAYKSRFGKVGFRKDLGLFVRSRWEANMIRIFKSLNFNVEYEPQSFKLPNGETYRPDLLLHETGELIEIKGRWLQNAKKKMKLFKSTYPQIKIEIIDAFKYKKYLREFSKLPNLEVA